MRSTKIDYMTCIGLALGILTIFVANHFEGGHLDSLLNPAAAIIVIGGSVAAVFLQSTRATLIKSSQILPWVIFPPSISLEKLNQKIMEWSWAIRRDGLAGVQNFIFKEQNPFYRQGLQLVMDGEDPQRIADILLRDIESENHRATHAANIFESMAGYAPTMGILGAVLGLIHVMGNLANPSQLGSGIATAFVATIYGVGFSNLIFFPIARKCRFYIQLRNQEHMMILEGLVAIAEGENPRMIQQRLTAYYEKPEITTLLSSKQDNKSAQFS
ncbi:MAG: flagellar motor protein [Pseudomonadota bacterium]